MPVLIKFLTPDGLEPAPYKGDSFADTTTHMPYDSVYTIANTFDRTKTLKLDAHLDRLEDSARRASIELVLNRPRLREALRTMIEQVNWGDVRYRITVGKNDPQTLILSIEPFSPLPATILENGTRCITAPNSARQNPEAKTTDWVILRQTLQDAMPSGIYDTFLLDAQGYILEGLASNFYAVLDGKLYTAGDGVLKGISQQIVLTVAPPILPVQLEAVHVRQIGQFQEAFLSSSSRGIVPVVEIDGVPMGDGRVGQVTRQLRQAYQIWLDDHLEEL